MNKYNILNGEYKSDENVLEIKTKNDTIYPYSAFFIKPESEEDKRTRIETQKEVLLDWTDIKSAPLRPIEPVEFETKEINVASLTPIEQQDLNIHFGDNTMKFKTNGEIYLNDRLIGSDEEIIAAFRKFLKIDCE